jgi:uncharacterized membrane-anchored protein
MDSKEPKLIHESAAKVPAITLGFWIIKLLATTLGEVGANALTMSYFGETTADVSSFWHDYGYLVGALIFLAFFLISVGIQIAVREFHPFIYWTTIVATTLLGTALADYFTRSIGVGYTGGSLILLAGVLGSLTAWRLVLGTISVESVITPKVEAFYWITIMWSQTLGTALGDWFADSAGLGYLWSSVIFAVMLLIIYILWRYTNLTRAGLFWAAFIITRPFGAVFGNFFDKPPASGGLGVNRFAASAIMFVLIVILILIFPQRPATAENGPHR